MNAEALGVLKQLDLGSVQTVRARVEHHAGEFSVLNVINCLECVDESKSEFLKWTRGDGRPDKVGEYRQITRLKIETSRVVGQHLFRIAGWRIALIGSEVLKQAMEGAGINGVGFSSVT